MIRYEEIKDMTAAEVLNYYRNLYYKESATTERGIIANAINDFFNEVTPLIKETAVKTRYKGKVYYLYKNDILDENLSIIIKNAKNGFLDLLEYFEYFPQNKKGVKQ